MSTDYFVLFESTNVNSFTSENLPGVNFLSVPPVRSVSYFIEDTAHQCGHNIISAMSFGVEDYFLDEEANKHFAEGRVKNDNRSAYVVFHGVFTEVMIAMVLSSFIENNNDPSDKLEAEGRLAFALKKFNVDVHITCLRWNLCQMLARN